MKPCRMCPDGSPRSLVEPDSHFVIGKLRDLHFSQRAVPIGLLLLCVLTFLPLIGWLGFYWDDWPTIWYLHNFGQASFREGFASDRPLLAYVFMLTTTIIGENPNAWQLFGILTRWSSALLFWWTARLVWPGKSLATTIMAVIFAIYPGFRQQYISVTYSNGFLVYSLYLLSFPTMLLAQRKTAWSRLLMLISVISATLALFISEYFFGLELLRPVLLWFAQKRDEKQRSVLIRRVFLLWLPYLAGAVAFLTWRLFLHTTPRGNLVLFKQLLSDPVTTLMNLSATIVQDIFEISILAWIKTVLLTRLVEFGLLASISLVVAALIIGALTVFALFRLRLPEAISIPGTWKERMRNGAGEMILAGLLALLVGGWPIWVTDLHFELIFPWDRFTMMMMPGVAMLTGGLISLVSRSQLRAALVSGLLVGLAAGMHLYDALLFKQEWQLQKAFFWQLTWRAPGLEPGTALLTSDLPFTFYSDNSLSAPLNWTYAPGNQSLNMPYLVFNLESRLYRDIPSLELGLPILMDYRVTDFQGSTSQSVLAFYKPPRCLKVMDPEEDRNLPYKPLLIPEALTLSDPGLIQAQADLPAKPPLEKFGPEPAPDWCYYFEKAELASQLGDWESVVELSSPALKLGKEFDRETASELVPYIKGLAHTGDLERAEELTLLAMQASPKMQNMLCQVWHQMRDELPDGENRDQVYDRLAHQIPCNFP